MGGALRGLALLVLLLAPWAAAADASPIVDSPTVAPPIVASIEWRIESWIGNRLYAESTLAFAPGDPLDEEAVRATLARLHATGWVADAAVFTRPAADGAASGDVVAVIAVWGFAWIDDVRIELLRDPKLGILDRRRLLRGLRQRARRAARATPTTARAPTHAAQEGADAARAYLMSRGFRRAQITARFDEASRARHGAETLVLTIDLGPRVVVRSFGLVGPDGIPLRDPAGDLEPATLLRALKLEAGLPYDEGVVAAARDRLAGALVGAGYLSAEVGDPEGDVDLLFPVNLGPRIDVVVEADVPELDRGRLLRLGLLPFLEDGGYDRARLRQTCDRLRAHFQRRGHYRARARCEEQSSDDDADDRLTVTIVLDRGPRYRVSDVRFEGNVWATDETLAARVAIEPHSPLRPRSGRLVDADLDSDLDNLRSFYLLAGFSDVDVGPARLDIVPGTADPADPGTIAVTIPIVEGRRQRVVSLAIEGARSLASADLLAGLPLRAGGGGYHPALLEESVARIRARYEGEGWPEAIVTPELDWTTDRRLVDVRLMVDEGRRSVLDHLIVRGQRRTRSRVFRRALGLVPGDVVARDRLLEAERALYRLGIFSRVSVRQQPPRSQEGQDARRDVVVTVEEGDRWRIGYGLGYHSDDGPGAVLTVSRANVGGRGDRLRLDLRANEVDQRYRLIFEQPAVTRFQLPVAYTLFFAEEERESFGAVDRGVQISVTKPWRGLRLGAVYDYRLIELSEGSSVETGPIDRTRAELQLSSVTPTLLSDRRDDPVSPRRGASDLVQLTWAFPFLAADASFLKLFWQHTRLLDFGRAGVLAASLRIGAIEPIGDGGLVPDPLVPDGARSAFVPISERFFAGGRTSHRAFERDTLGIDGATLLASANDGVVPIGGNGLALLNVDYRFPIAGVVGGVVFFDFGNVWPDWRDIEFDDARPGAGLGVRYRSPIGPLRLEVGWNLDRQPGEDSPVFFLSFGNPF